MRATCARVRALIAVLALAGVAAPAAANVPPPSPGPRATEAARTPASQREPPDAPPAGSPELGVLLIIGVVAFLVVMAWVLSRVGDDSPRDDGTII